MTVSTASAASPNVSSGSTFAKIGSDVGTQSDETLAEGARNFGADSDDDEDDSSETIADWRGWSSWNNGKARTSRTAVAVKKML